MSFEEEMLDLSQLHEKAKEYNRNIMQQIENQLIDASLTIQSLQDGVPVVNNDPNESLQLSASTMRQTEARLVKSVEKAGFVDLNKSYQCPEDFVLVENKPPTVEHGPKQPRFYTFNNKQMHEKQRVADISIKNGLNFEAVERTQDLTYSVVRSTTSLLNGHPNEYFTVFSSPRCRKSVKLQTEGYPRIGVSMAE